MIKLLADSTCDLSDEIIKKYNISIAPLSILINGKTYKDRIDIFPEDFYKLLPTLDTLPTTSMPSPLDFRKIIDEAVENGFDELICIAMSSGTSGSFHSAMLAKTDYYEDNPDSKVKIHIVDSKCMSHGSGYLLMKSAQLIEDGIGYEEIVEFNETFKMNVKHFLAVDDLDNLIKSGRLTNVSAMIGKILNIKPLMSMRNGKGAIVAKVRSNKKVISHYIKEFDIRADRLLTDFLIIGYTSDRTKAESLEIAIREKTDFDGDIYIMQMGVSVGTHVGMGGLSFYFIETGDRHDGLFFNELQDFKERKNKFSSRFKELKDKHLKELSDKHFINRR